MVDFFFNGAFVFESSILGYIILFLILSVLFKKSWNDTRFSDTMLLMTAVFYSIAILILIATELFWLIDNTKGVSLYYHTNVFFTNYAFFSMKLFSVLAIYVCILITLRYFSLERILTFEYSIFILLFTISVTLLISCMNLFVCFLLIEIQSLILYILVAIKRYSNTAVEASVKYFLVSAFASACILIGISLIYSQLGTLNFFEIEPLVKSAIEDQFLFFSVVIVFIGLFIKIAVFPFHFWIADVYEGAPAVVTSFLAIVTKLPLVFLIMKLYVYPFSAFAPELSYLLIGVGLISFIYGTNISLYEHNFKRLIAYSSVTHFGFMFIILSLGTVYCYALVFFYLFIYILCSIAYFTLLVNARYVSYSFEDSDNMPIAIRSNYQTIRNVMSFAIWNQKSNFFFAFIIALVFLSLAGVPPLAGFFSKFMTFQALVNSDNIFVAFVVIFISIFAMIYYLRLVRFLIIRMNDQSDLFKKERNKLQIDISKSASLLISICVYINLLLILFFPLLFTLFFCMGLDIKSGLELPRFLFSLILGG
jgi:NADH-quinone oxidoreductase subunit N